MPTKQEALQYVNALANGAGLSDEQQSKLGVVFTWLESLNAAEVVEYNCNHSKALNIARLHSKALSSGGVPSGLTEAIAAAVNAGLTTALGPGFKNARGQTLSNATLSRATLSNARHSPEYLAKLVPLPPDFFNEPVRPDFDNEPLRPGWIRNQY
mmetsp:Transcript_12433/g.21988  ORF Transcript_12433/g.21988 Transcript_12433/m.21988 type:complete len:155 (+) Transcript_12433:190-654(+)